VEIVYDATVTNDAEKTVNPDDNTVTVNFSNTPDDEEGHGILKDKTKHYTFDIDAELLGEDGYRVFEIVKVGLDADGNEITTEVETNYNDPIGAAEGAEFGLFIDEGCKTKYTNAIYDEDTVIVSDDKGLLTVKDAEVPGIRGLDAGTYYLKETKAPAGYVMYDKAVKIEIKATLEEVAYDVDDNVVEDPEKDADKVSYTVNELKSYTIEIDGNKTAEYTITNSASDKGDKYITTSTSDGKIPNTQGMALPSTGGIGTTLFYIIGSILVIGAGVILVAKRRMSVN
jgi:LPXTG-motif cell wall-anchored protein